MSPAKSKTTTPATQPAKQPSIKTEATVQETKQNRQYIYSMVAISAVIVIIGSFFSYRLFKTYIHRTNEIKAQDKYINALKQKKEDLNTLQTNYNAMIQKGSNNLSTADVIYRAVPIDAEYKTLIGVMENMAKDSGVSVSVTPTAKGLPTSSGASGSANANASSNSNDVSTFTFSVSVQGPFDQILKFMKDAEQSLRPINFKSMNVTGTSGTIQADIVFDTYYKGKADISNKTEPLK